MKEQLVQLASDMPEWMAVHALTVLQTFIKAVAEAEDDAYCIKLLNNSLEEPDEGEGIPFEEVVAQLGIELK